MNLIRVMLLVTSLIALESYGMSHKRTVQPEPSPTASPSSTPTPKASPAASPVAGTSPSPAQADNITFKCLVCTTTEQKTIVEVQKRLNAIVQTKCFHDHFTDPKYRSHLVQTNGLTAEQVVTKIKTSVIKNIPISFYTEDDSGVYGYTYPTDPTIYLNRAYRTAQAVADGDWGMCAEVSNETHESTHKMGFDHDFDSTERRPYSVPYTANYAVDSCCKN
jgi:hypothetical protein